MDWTTSLLTSFTYHFHSLFLSFHCFFLLFLHLVATTSIEGVKESIIIPTEVTHLKIVQIFPFPPISLIFILKNTTWVPFPNHCNICLYQESSIDHLMVFSLLLSLYLSWEVISKAYWSSPFFFKITFGVKNHVWRIWSTNWPPSFFTYWTWCWKFI